jgi:hypothetical protein
MITDHIRDIGGSVLRSIIVESHVAESSLMSGRSRPSVLDMKPVVACSASKKPYRLSLVHDYERRGSRGLLSRPTVHVGWGGLERRHKAMEPSGKHI